MDPNFSSSFSTSRHIDSFSGLSLVLIPDLPLGGDKTFGGWKNVGGCNIVGGCKNVGGSTTVGGVDLFGGITSISSEFISPWCPLTSLVSSKNEMEADSLGGSRVLGGTATERN